MSLANTTSADQVLISFKPAVAGDCIPDSSIEELGRRIIGEVDSSARNADPTVVTQGSKQAVNSTLALGATEITFTWLDPFPNTSYGFQIYPTSDPGAPYRCWVKSKTTTKITFGMVGQTAAVSLQFIAFPI